MQTPERLGVLDGLPSGAAPAKWNSTLTDRDELAKRFDLMVISSQLSVLYADHTLSKFERPIRAIADGLLEQLTIPKIKEKEELLRDVASDEWSDES
ncbi:hypothetical protein ACNHUS_26410 [Actinomycetes bacterium M1A6_2h]